MISFQTKLFLRNSNRGQALTESLVCFFVFILFVKLIFLTFYFSLFSMTAQNALEGFLACHEKRSLNCRNKFEDDLSRLFPSISLTELKSTPDRKAEAKFLLLHRIPFLITGSLE